MTETDNVSKKLIEDAENDRQEILSEANQKVESILKEADERKEAISADGKILAQNAYKHEYDFIISQFNSQLNQKFLMEKIKIVEDVVKKIVKKLENLEEPEYKKALLKFAHEINIKKGVYQIGKNEKRITDVIVKEIFENSLLDKSDNEPNFNDGIKITDRRKEYYFSGRILIESESEETIMEISKLLFD